MFGLPEKSYQMIIDAVASFPEFEQALVFGSRAKENFKRGSDVDLAIMGEKVTEEIRLRLSTLLNEELPLPYFFDVVNYIKITEPALIERIDRVGKLLYSQYVTHI